MSQGELPDELSCDSAFSACARASQPLAAVAYLRTVQHFGESLLPRGENDIMTAASTVCYITVPPFCPPEGGALLHFNRTALALVFSASVFLMHDTKSSRSKPPGKT